MSHAKCLLNISVSLLNWPWQQLFAMSHVTLWEPLKVEPCCDILSLYSLCVTVKQCEMTSHEALCGLTFSSFKHRQHFNQWPKMIVLLA